MPISRLQAEQELIARTKKLMELVGFSTEVNGANSDLDSPMQTALRKMGSPVSGVLVSDVDLSVLDESQIDEFFDRAELRLLQNIQGSFTLADSQIGSRRENYQWLQKELTGRIEKVAQAVGSTYGDSGSTLQSGFIGLDFAEKGDDVYYS